ncbi:MAG: hypothetical protein ACYC3L_00225 [Gemmatimonadaceae bacterium]
MTLDSVDIYGTSLFCDVLTAYRRDLERTPDVVQFGEHDADWLRFALRVERVASLAPPRPRRGSAAVRHPILRPQRLLAAAEKMEAAGALTLAFTLLGAARRIWDTADPSNAGVAIFRQARICRTMGATQAAETFFSFLHSFATRHRLAELRGRALVGRGFLRMLRGDSAAALRWYERARADSGYNAVAVAVSYHAEMFLALAADDSSHALVAGSKAIATHALASHDEAGLMVNIAAIVLRAGRPRTAMRVLKQAIAKTRHPRVRLIAYSKAALAAAAQHKVPVVERMAGRVVATAARVNIPFEELEARSEVAQAFAIVGETAKARRLARAARTEALAQGFAVIVQRCDAILSAQADLEPILVLSAPARRVVAELELV